MQRLSYMGPGFRQGVIVASHDVFCQRVGHRSDFDPDVSGVSHGRRVANGLAFVRPCVAILVGKHTCFN